MSPQAVWTSREEVKSKQNKGNQMKKKGKEKEAKKEGPTVNAVNAASGASSNSPLILNTNVSIASATNGTIVFDIAHETRWILDSG